MILAIAPGRSERKISRRSSPGCFCMIADDAPTRWSRRRVKGGSAAAAAACPCCAEEEEDDSPVSKRSRREHDCWFDVCWCCAVLMVSHHSRSLERRSLCSLFSSCWGGRRHGLFDLFGFGVSTWKSFVFLSFVVCARSERRTTERGGERWRRKNGSCGRA